MATNNPIDSLDPIQVALGGTGDSTLTSKGVLYGNGTSPVGVTSVGTSGQYLMGNGSGAAPTFQNGPTGTSVFNKVSAQTASNSVSLVFGWGGGSTQTSVFVFNNIVPVNNGDYFGVIIGASPIGSYSPYGFVKYNTYNSTTYSSFTNYGSGFAPGTITSTLSNTANKGASGTIIMSYAPGWNSVKTWIAIQYNAFGNAYTSDLGEATQFITDAYSSQSTSSSGIGSITFSMNTGNISSGTITQYSL